MDATEKVIRPMPPFLRMVGDSARGALLIVLAVLVLDGIVEQFIIVKDDFAQLLTGSALLIPTVAVLVIGCRLIFRSDDEKYLTRVALAIVGLSLVLRLIWIFAVDSYQVNDFGEYLNNATDRTDTFFRRASFYTYPLVLVFGKSLMAVKVTNVLLATATTWVSFLAGKIVVGARAAAIALIFFIWNADLWYSMTLASHDIPGLFWLGLFFYLSVLLQRRLWTRSNQWLCNSALSVLVGGCVFFVGAVRSYQDGAMLALLTCAVIHSTLIIFPGTGKESRPAALPDGFPHGRTQIRNRFRTAALHTALLFAVPLAVHQVAEAEVWKAFKLEFDGIGPRLVCYLTATDVLGTSEHDEITNWYEEQCPIIKEGEQRQFAVRKLLHEVTHSPAGYLLHLERKNRVLSRTDAYLGWSTSATYESWDTTRDQVKRINSFNYYAQQLAITLAHAFVLLLVLWRIFLYPGQPLRLAETVPIAFSAVYYAMFLFLLESQSRYDIFLIFMFSWMAAEAVVDLHRRSNEKLRPALEVAGIGGKRRYFGAAAILVTGAGIYVLASSLVADSPLTLRDQSGFVKASRGDTVIQLNQSPEVAPVFVKNNFKQLMLAYPAGAGIPSGSIIAAQRTFSVGERSRHHLRFFLSTREVRSGPFSDKKSWEDKDIEYLLAVNRQVIATGKLNDIAGNRYFSFDSARDSIFAPRMTLQLILRNVSTIENVDPNRGPIVSLEYIDLQ